MSSITQSNSELAYRASMVGDAKFSGLDITAIILAAIMLLGPLAAAAFRH